MDNLMLFYDGCHKIYYAERSDTVTIGQMKEWGYDIIDGSFDNNLRELWDASCSLRFVQPADFDSKKPQIWQFQTDGLRDLVEQLANYYREVAA